MTPIYQTSTYIQDGVGGHKGYEYSRTLNPTRHALEKNIAAIENARFGAAFGSGLAAIDCVVKMLNPGDEVISTNDLYGGTYRLFTTIFAKYGIKFQFVDMSNPANIEAFVTEKTKLIWVETPANPLLSLSDIEAIATLSHGRGIRVGVDNTIATPIFQNPLALGADIVMHATTKYIGGHSDVLGGAIVVKENDAWADRIQRVQILMGATPNPLDCYLLARGLKTLPIRMREQAAIALDLAKKLENHPQIAQVHYPGLPSHPQYALAMKQMPMGQSAMISIQIQGDETRARQVANALTLFTQATSLGGVESLVEHRRSIEGPASTTPGNLLRLSIGLEHVDDLWADLQQALQA